MFVENLTEIMTLSELILAKGIKKEHIVKVTGIARNRFYCNLKKPVKFRPDEIEKIAQAINVSSQTLIDSIK